MPVYAADDPAWREALLDHGHLRVIESWGADERVIEAARQSTGKGFLGWGPTTCACGGKDGYKCDKCRGFGEVPGDEKLLRFLHMGRPKHTSPFEFAGMIVEVQAPLIVFREWHRHRTQSYNEMSGRYTKLPDLYYVPSVERLQNAAQSKTNKQSSTGGLDAGVVSTARSVLEKGYKEDRARYELLLSIGVAREIARLALPVAQYSRMWAAANLKNWLDFLTLREDEAAQWEIRQYAHAVGRMIQQAFPRTHALFVERRDMEANR